MLGCYYVFINKIDSAILLFDNLISIRKIISKNNLNEVNISFKQIGEGGPVPDETNAAALLIKNLSMTDFPDNKLDIDENGEIKIRKN